MDTAFIVTFVLNNLSLSLVYKQGTHFIIYIAEYVAKTNFYITI